MLGGLRLFLFLAAPLPCQAQSPAVETPAAAITPPNQTDMFGQVIANQKRVDADLNQYERIERVEIRKTGSDAKPSEVKVWRVFPSGTGLSKIVFTPEGLFFHQNG